MDGFFEKPVKMRSRGSGHAATGVCLNIRTVLRVADLPASHICFFFASRSKLPSRAAAVVFGQLCGTDRRTPQRRRHCGQPIRGGDPRCGCAPGRRLGRADRARDATRSSGAGARHDVQPDAGAVAALVRGDLRQPRGDAEEAEVEGDVGIEAL